MPNSFLIGPIVFDKILKFNLLVAKATRLLHVIKSFSYFQRGPPKNNSCEVSEIPPSGLGEDVVARREWTNDRRPLITKDHIEPIYGLGELIKEGLRITSCQVYLSRDM